MHTRPILFIILLIYLLNPHCGLAQNNRIAGTLKFEDGLPVPYATLVIPSLNKHTLSGEDGKYEFFDVPAGTYQLQVLSIEVEKKEFTVRVPSTGNANSFVLKRAGNTQLAEVKVVGASVKQQIEKSGFSASVIETQKSALQSVQTNDLLNRAVGIRVRQNGGLGSAVVYNLNGMSGNSVRVFIDGIPISTYGSSYSLNSIPPALIERVEVYKGVIPAHLADDALGGAINVVLKKGLQSNLSASVSYGSFNTQQANINAMYRNPETGFTAKASGFYNYSDNDYEVWGKFVRNTLANGRYEYVRAKRFNDAYRSAGGFVEVGFTDVKWADLFLVGYNASEEYKEIQHGVYMTIPYKGRFAESSSGVASINYHKRNLLLNGLEFNLSANYSKRNEVVNDTVKWNYNWFGERSIGLDGRPILRPDGAQQDKPTINNINRNITTIRSGFNYDFATNHRLVLNHMFFQIDRTEQDEMRSVTERNFIGTRDLTKNITALAYELNAFDDRLKSNLFGKLYQQNIERMNPVLVNQGTEKVRVEDRIESKYKTTGFGWALSFTLIPELTLLTSAEKAVRLPSENEIFGSPGENITENVNLRPEVSNNLNVGFRSTPYSTDDHKITFGLTGFIRDTKDKIARGTESRNNNDAIQTAPNVNINKTKSIGFEGELGYEYKSNLSISVNFSRFNSVFNQRLDPNGNTYPNYNQQLPNEPFFTLNSNVQYALKNLIQENATINLNYSFGFVEKFYTTWSKIEYFRTPRQYIQDLGVNYVFPSKKFVVSIDVRNIFNKQAFDNFAVQKPGRGFYLKLNYTLNKF